MTEENISRWKTMVEASPKDELACFSLGNAYWEANRFLEAKEAFARAASLKEDWMAVLILLGKCHLELGEKKEAKAVLQKALDLAIRQHHDGPREEMEALLKELG